MEKEYLYKNVMIVDDSNLDRIFSAAMIKGNSFAESVIAFSSVGAAVPYLQSLAVTHAAFPPVIFLDVNMPVMDGFDFLDVYSAFPEEVRMGCRVIMISATNSEDDLRRIHASPIVSMFFTKPLSNDILNAIRERFTL